MSESEDVVPLRRLPEELVILVLSYLDASTLLKCRLIDTFFRRLTSDPHLWKNIELTCKSENVKEGRLPIVPDFIRYLVLDDDMGTVFTDVSALALAPRLQTLHWQYREITDIGALAQEDLQ